MAPPIGAPMNDPAKAVFVSYTSQDVEPVRRLCKALEAARIEVWFDQNELQGGDAWDAAIRKRIKDCQLFVPVVSANTDARSEGYFRLEWKLAVDRSHLIADDRAFLLPVVVDDTPEAAARVPDRFREVQWTRLPGGDNAKPFAERTKRLLESTFHRAVVARADRGTPSIAVLPFANVGGDPADDYFGQGLTEDLVTDIGRLSRMSVLPSSALKDGAIDAERAKELGIDYLLMGSVRRSDDRIRLNVQLVDAATARHIWTQRYDRALADLFDTQDEMTRAIVSELEVRIVEGAQAVSWQRGTQSPLALDHFFGERDHPDWP